VRAAAALLVLFAATRAHAEPWPGRLVVPPGLIDVAITVEVNLGVREVAEPVSIAPDVWWGATDRVTVGVTTSARALSRYETGHGLCVHECERLYDNLAIDARGEVAPWAAARLRVVARSFAPFKPSARLGAVVRARRGAWAIEADPHVQTSLGNRALGNRDQVSLPVWLRFQLGCRAAGWVFTGARGEIAGLREKVVVPIGAGVVVGLGAVDVAIEAGLPAALGPQNQSKPRMAWLTVGWRGGDRR
jgi:hypothetical protein